MVGLAADHEAVEQEDVALVFGSDPRERALHDELVAALADVFALPAVDVPLDLIHLLDGQVFALHLLAVEAARRLAETQNKTVLILYSVLFSTKLHLKRL